MTVTTKQIADWYKNRIHFNNEVYLFVYEDEQQYRFNSEEYSSTRFKNYKDHNLAVQQACDILKQQGVNAILIKFNEFEYGIHKGAKEDSFQAKQEWARFYFLNSQTPDLVELQNMFSRN